MPRQRKVKELSEHELVAYRDGKMARDSGQERHERIRVYTDQKDRDAFDTGWDQRGWEIDRWIDVPVRYVTLLSEGE